MGHDGRCPRCGAQMAADLPEGLCPRCLLGEAGGCASGTGLDPGAAPAAAGAMPAHDVPPEIPRYRVVRLIGVGGMGAVYEAVQQHPRRTVALKVIRPHLATPQVLARFAHEAEALGRLQHPGIAQVYESGTAETDRGPQPFFAMEFIRGPGGQKAPPLTAYAQEAQLTVRQRLELIAKVGDAVHYAHQKGIIHRDLKPANIPVDETGQPKILDFGVARITGSDIQAATMQTDVGQILGTLPYMSPEQAGGDPAELDTRADVYALGVTCYELLTGRLPHVLHRRGIAEAVRVIREEEPTRLSSISRGFRGDVEPIVARRPSTWYQLHKFAKRNKALVGGLAGVFVALVLGIIGTTIGLLRARSAQQEEAQQRRRAERAGQTAQEAEKVATERLWQSYLAQARAGRWSARAGQGFASLDALAAAAAIRPSRELRDEAIACMALADLRLDRRLGASSRSILRYGPTGKHYAQDDGQGNLSIRRVADNSELLRLPSPGPRGGEPVFSPDGRLLAQRYFRRPSYECYVWELKAGKVILKAPVARYGWVMDFGLSGRLIAIGGPDKSVRLYDLHRPRYLRSLPTEAVPGWIRFHPHGGRLAVVGLNGRMLDVFDWTTRKVVHGFLHPTKVFGLSWRPDGWVLTATCGDFNIYVWNVNTGKRQAVLRGHQAEVTGVTFNHAGDLLASRSWDGTVRLWDPVGGRHLVRVDTRSAHLQFSLDDEWLLSQGVEAVDFWEVARRQCRTFHELAGGSKGPWCVEYSPDGRLLASAGDDGVRVWDALGGGSLFLSLGKTMSAIFDPADGNLVTSGASGLRRWPIVIDDRAKTLRIRPPTVLCEALGSPGDARASLSPRTQSLAVIEGAGKVAIWDLRQARRTAVLQPHPGVSYVAISPDGRWAATGTWDAPGVKVWDARRGTLVRDLLGKYRRSQVAFSPDGRWLATSSDRECQLWEFGSWSPGRRFPRDRLDMAGPVAFSPDGRILAIAPSRYLVHLIDPSTGDRLASLASPDPGQLSWFGFSPDGSRLAAASTDHRIQLWDLRGIRNRLAAMRLDWPLPPYPPGRKQANLHTYRAWIDKTPGPPGAPNGPTSSQSMPRDLLAGKEPHSQPATAPAREMQAPPK